MQNFFIVENTCPAHMERLARDAYERYGFRDEWRQPEDLYEGVAPRDCLRVYPARSGRTCYAPEWKTWAKGKIRSGWIPGPILHPVRDHARIMRAIEAKDARLIQKKIFITSTLDGVPAKKSAFVPRVTIKPR